MNKWVESLLEYYRVGGWLPNGPPGVEYCDIMGAQHEIPLMVSAYQKGIRNYDVDKAYEAVKKTLTTQGTALSSGGIVGNRHLDVYLKYGFVPYGEKSHHNVFGTTYEGPTSNTLEYAFDDWNAAQFAKALGYEEDYDYFTRRAYNYKMFSIRKRNMSGRNIVMERGCRILNLLIKMSILPVGRGWALDL